jgi:hypothetical protein
MFELLIVDSRSRKWQYTGLYLLRNLHCIIKKLHVHSSYYNPLKNLLSEIVQDQQQEYYAIGNAIGVRYFCIITEYRKNSNNFI